MKKSVTQYQQILPDLGKFYGYLDSDNVSLDVDQTRECVQFATVYFPGGLSLSQHESDLNSIHT